MADKDPDTESPEARTEHEVEREAATSETDPITAREGLEEDLMEHDESEAGKHIGEHID